MYFGSLDSSDLLGWRVFGPNPDSSLAEKDQLFVHKLHDSEF